MLVGGEIVIIIKYAVIYKEVTLHCGFRLLMGALHIGWEAEFLLVTCSDVKKGRVFARRVVWSWQQRFSLKYAVVPTAVEEVDASIFRVIQNCLP